MKQESDDELDEEIIAMQKAIQDTGLLSKEERKRRATLLAQQKAKIAELSKITENSKEVDITLKESNSSSSSEQEEELKAEIT